MEELSAHGFITQRLRALLMCLPSRSFRNQFPFCIMRCSWPCCSDNARDIAANAQRSREKKRAEDAAAAAG